MGSINSCSEVDENTDNEVINQLPRDQYISTPIKLKEIEINQSLKRSNSEKSLKSSNRPKCIDILSPFELCDEITEIFRIRIPFFNYKPLQSLSAISFLTGNGPYHEGLLIITQFKNIYITQIYPITFLKVKNLSDALLRIISFNTFNIESKKYQISDIYIPNQTVTVMDIYSLVNKYPNKYNTFSQNCQKYCDTIIYNLNKKFKIKRENKVELIKLHYRKIKESFNRRKSIENSHKPGNFLFHFITRRNSEELVKYIDKRPKLKIFRKRTLSVDNTNCTSKII